MKSIILLLIAVLASLGADAAELCRDNIQFDPVSKTHFGWFALGGSSIRVELNQAWKTQKPMSSVVLKENGKRFDILNRHDFDGVSVAEGVLSGRNSTLSSGIYSYAGSANPKLLSAGYPVASLRMSDGNGVIFVQRSSVPHARGQGKLVTIEIDGGASRLSEEKYLPGEPLSVEPNGDNLLVIGSAGDWSWAASVDRKGNIHFVECGRPK